MRTHAEIMTDLENLPRNDPREQELLSEMEALLKHESDQFMSRLSTTPIRTKNPIAAAILSLIFGPLGYFYVGWRYGLAGTVFVLLVTPIMALVLALTGFILPGVWSYAAVIPIAWKGFTICQAYNASRLSRDVNLAKPITVDSFTAAAIAMSDLFVGIVQFYSVAIGLYASINALTGGDLATGFLLLLIATPVFVFFNGLIAGLLATGFDTIVLFVARRDLVA